MSNVNVAAHRRSVNLAAYVVYRHVPAHRCDMVEVERRRTRYLNIKIDTRIHMVLVLWIFHGDIHAPLRASILDLYQVGVRTFLGRSDNDRVPVITLHRNIARDVAYLDLSTRGNLVRFLEVLRLRGNHRQPKY